MRTRENDRTAEDDLSDVIPLGVTIAISDGVQEMKFGKRICEIQGYGEDGWTTEQMLDYFQDLCRVYDAWAESKKPWAIPDDYGDLRLPENPLAFSGYAPKWAELRDFVGKCYDKYVAVSMADLLEHLGVPIAHWQQSVGGGRVPATIINADQLGLIEGYYTAIKMPYVIGQLEAETGLSRGSLDTMRRQFTARRLAIHGEQALLNDRAPLMLRHLVKEGHHTNADILRIVHEATGVKFSKSYVSKVRVEMRSDK